MARTTAPPTARGERRSLRTWTTLGLIPCVAARMAPKSKSAVRTMWSFSAAHCINSLSVALFEPTLDQWIASKPASARNLALLRAPRRITQRFEDVIAIQIRIVSQELVNRQTPADLCHDHADRNSHPADAWLAAHDGGILSDPGKFAHDDNLFLY